MAGSLLSQVSKGLVVTQDMSDCLVLVQARFVNGVVGYEWRYSRHQMEVSGQLHGRFTPDKTVPGTNWIGG
jgi:hypothetical protein